MVKRFISVFAVVLSTFALGVVSVLALPAVSQGAIGTLTLANCIEDVGSSAPCAVSQQGLSGADDIAVSADGKSVYVVGVYDDSIARFDRDPATGALTPQGCISDVEYPICGVTQQGLNAPVGVAVSPDGKSVYVVSRDDDTIVRFDRDATTGALTSKGCKVDPIQTGLCGADNVVDGLSNANDVAVSPDNESVYVAGAGYGAIVNFDRDTVSDVGAITLQECFVVTGGGICGPNEEDGLGEAYGLAISPDGKSIYVVSRSHDAIVRFDRSLVNGALTKQGCIRDSDNGSSATCGPTQQGLDGAHNVTVSPDGKSVYVAAGGTGGGVVRFDRDTLTGALTGQGCISDDGTAVGCATTQQGLAKSYAIVASPDNKSVYVTGASDHAIVNFDRDSSTGALTAQGYLNSPGLSNPYGIAISPDGGSVFAASEGTGAIFCYARDLTGSGSPSGCGLTAGPPATPPSGPAQPSNDFKFKNPFRLPSNGTVTYRFDLPGGGTILVHATGVWAPPRARPSGLRTTAKRKKMTIAKKRVTVTRAGIVKVVLKPGKAAKKYLRKHGKLKATVKITYTPTGGTPKTVTDKVTFKLKRK